MNYIDALAREIGHRVDDYALGPDEMILYRMYALLALAKGAETTMEDVHNAWSAWMSGKFPDHHSLIPYGDLPEVTQEMDRPYMEAIHAAASLAAKVR